MKKTKVLALILAVAMIICCLPMNAFAAGTTTVVANSDASTHLQWKFDVATQTLNIFVKQSAVDDETPGALDVKKDGVTGELDLAWFDSNDAVLGATSIIIGSYINDVKDTGAGTFFAKFKDLKSIELSGAMKAIPSYAFYGLENLEAIEIPANVTTIGSNAFQDCTALKDVKFDGAEKLTAIGDYAFMRSGITSIDVPKAALGGADNKTKVATIGDSVFAGCESLTTATIGENWASVGDGLFASVDIAYDDRLTTVEFKDSETTIGTGLFVNCTFLTTAKLPSKITEIPTKTFKGCTALTSFEVPTDVTVIGASAFEGCSDLATLTYKGKKVTKLDTDALKGCESLKKIEITRDMAHVEGAFADCKSVDEIVVDSGNTYYKSVDNCLLTNDGKELILACNTSKLPEKIEKIRDAAFGACSELKEIVVPSTVKQIDNGAFRGAEKVESITLNDFYNIADKFGGASNIPDTLKTLKFTGGSYFTSSAVFGVGELTSIEFPKTMKDFASGSLSFALELSSITVADGNNYFKAAGNCLYTIKRTASWSEKVIVAGTKDATIPADVATEIGAYAFANVLYNKPNNKILIIPEGIEKIGDYAFSNAQFKFVVLPKSIEDVTDSCLLVSTTKYVGTEDELKKVKGAGKYTCNYINKLTYSDCDANAWYADAVLEATNDGLFQGYGDGSKFGPADNIQRQDFILVLARARNIKLDEYTAENLKFADVDKNAYYAKAIAWAVDVGIITGYDNGKFGVGDAITREQLVTILYRQNVTKSTLGNLLADADTKFGVDYLNSVYADFGAVSSYAKQAVVWALNNQIISGRSATEIAPVGNANRAEVAKMYSNKKGAFKATMYD